MQVAISCFLCPFVNNCLDTKYIWQLGDLEQASSFDLCQLVYNHLIVGVTKYLEFIKAKGSKPKLFEFCSYALAVSMIFFIVNFPYLFLSHTCFFIYSMFFYRCTTWIVLILVSTLLVVEFPSKSHGVVT
jgi:hypothetical protein